MKINFNSNNIKKALCIGTFVLILAGGSWLIEKTYSKEENTEANKSRIIELDSTNACYEMVFNNVEYVAPEGYDLEVVNGNLHAVKRYCIVEEPIITKDKEGRVIYVGPSDSVVVDGKSYRVIVVYAAPVVKDQMKSM